MWPNPGYFNFESIEGHSYITLVHRTVVYSVNLAISLNREREREMFYLTTHSTHFIYGYMASDIWLRTILIVRKETRCRHIGYSFRLATHGLCYTNRGVLAGTRNSSMALNRWRWWYIIELNTTLYYLFIYLLFLLIFI